MISGAHDRYDLLLVTQTSHHFVVFKIFVFFFFFLKKKSIDAGSRFFFRFGQIKSWAGDEGDATRTASGWVNDHHHQGVQTESRQDR